MEDLNHCKDCCCAKSWEALGIKEYTGKSIPEEILRTKDELCRFQRLWNSAEQKALGFAKTCDKQAEELAKVTSLYHEAITGDKMKNISRTIRLLLSGALLYYVWGGRIWAIALVLTLCIIRFEFEDLLRREL